MKVTDELKELATEYLEMVDEPGGHTDTPERDAERTVAHEALMDGMERCGIPFNSRWEARWIARWISGDWTDFSKFPTTQLMFGHVLPNGKIDKMFITPPDDNKERLTPMVVIAIRFDNQPMNAERNLL